MDFDQGPKKDVNRLREVLEDSADSLRFIETLPRKGYRFIGIVETIPAANAAVDSPETPVSTPQSS